VICLRNWVLNLVCPANLDDLQIVKDDKHNLNKNDRRTPNPNLSVVILFNDNAGGHPINIIRKTYWIVTVRTVFFLKKYGILCYYNVLLIPLYFYSCLKGRAYTIVTVRYCILYEH
jgi:hypothetical protein